LSEPSCLAGWLEVLRGVAGGSSPLSYRSPVVSAGALEVLRGKLNWFSRQNCALWHAFLSRKAFDHLQRETTLRVETVGRIAPLSRRVPSRGGGGVQGGRRPLRCRTPLLSAGGSPA